MRNLCFWLRSSLAAEEIGRSPAFAQWETIRLDPAKVDHFLDFISSPSFLQDVAYGTRNLKLSTGEKIEIPSVVRPVISSRLVQLYLKYCAESAFEPLRRSTLFSIIKVSLSVTVVSNDYNRCH